MEEKLTRDDLIRIAAKSAGAAFLIIIGFMLGAVITEDRQRPPGPAAPTVPPVFSAPVTSVPPSLPCDCGYEH